MAAVAPASVRPLPLKLLDRVVLSNVLPLPVLLSKRMPSLPRTTVPPWILVAAPAVTPKVMIAPLATFSVPETTRVTAEPLVTLSNTRAPSDALVAVMA